MPRGDHFALIAHTLARGLVVPFLGAGANLCDRPDGAAWESGLFVPSGAELARVLAERSGYPDPDEPDLTWVAQYLVSVKGEMELYRLLHSVFEADYQPTSLHLLLARLPAILRERGLGQLIVLTTNYDVLVERALEDAGEQFDVLWYEAKDRHTHRGLFMHRRPEGDVVPVKKPVKYVGIPTPLERPVVVKLHGSVDRYSYEDDSYVLDEESYIRYLSGPGLNELIPVTVMAEIVRRNLLFLGYSMRDWNVRAMLSDDERTRSGRKAWSVQLQPASEATRIIMRQIWDRLGMVEILDIPLSDFVSELTAELEAAQFR